MRLYDNPLLAIIYLIGKTTNDKLQNAINEREKKKRLESTIQYISSDEEERKRYLEISNNREERLEKCISIIIIEMLILFIQLLIFPEGTFDFPPIVAYPIIAIIAFPMFFSIGYIIWYFLYG